MSLSQVVNLKGVLITPLGWVAGGGLVPSGRMRIPESCCCSFNAEEILIEVVGFFLLIKRDLTSLKSLLGTVSITEVQSTCQTCSIVSLF